MKTIKFISLLAIIIFSNAVFSQDTSAVKAKPKKDTVKQVTKQDSTSDKLLFSFGAGMVNTLDKDSAINNSSFHVGIGFYSKSFIPVFLNIGFEKEMTGRNSLKQVDIFVSVFAPFSKFGKIMLSGEIGAGLSFGNYRNEVQNKIIIKDYKCPIFVFKGGLMLPIEDIIAISFNGIGQFKKYRSFIGGELDIKFIFDI